VADRAETGGVGAGPEREPEMAAREGRASGAVARPEGEEERGAKPDTRPGGDEHTGAGRDARPNGDAEPGANRDGLPGQDPDRRGGLEPGRNSGEPGAIETGPGGRIAAAPADSGRAAAPAAGIEAEHAGGLAAAGADTGRETGKARAPEAGAGAVAAAEVEPPATIGAQLRRAREAAGLDLAAICRRTKIRRGLLLALEEDRHDDLPALAYSLGFVRAYAQAVGLDPQAAADRYRRESLKGEPVPVVVDLAPLDERQIPSRGLAWAGALAALAVLAGFLAWGAGLFDPALPPEPRVAEAPAAPALPPEPQAPAEPAAAPASGPVTLRAREDVWVRIDNRETGARFFEGTLVAGQELAIPPGEPLQLRTGRAGAIEVRVGSAALPPLGGPVERIRGVSLLPEDLAVRQPRGPVPGLAEAPRPGA